MAPFDANEMLRVNDKIHTVALRDPTRVNNDDIDLFVVKQPPAAVDLNLRAPINSMASNLCDAYHTALQYFSFWLTAKSAVITAEEKEGVGKLLPACVVHISAKTLQQGESASCHLCVFLMVKIRVERIAMHSITQSNIKMCWESRETKPTRLHFAVVHQGHPKSTNNYLNILRLRLWPSSEFNIQLLDFTKTSPRLERHSNTGSPRSRHNALQWLRRYQANNDGKHHQYNQPSGE